MPMQIEKAKFQEWAKELNSVLDVARANIGKNRFELLQLLSKDDVLWSMIWSSNDQDNFYLTRSGYRLLEKIVTRYLEYFSLSQVSIQKLMDIFIKEISAIFKAKPKKQWSYKDISSSLENIKIFATQQLVETTHYKVCMFPNDNSLDEFLIGPVKFVKPDKLWKSLEDRIGEYVNNDKNSRYISDAKEYYEKYDWIACITIFNCNENVSHRHAEVCIDLVVNFISLFFNNQFIEITSEESLLHKKEYDIYIDHTGKLNVNYNLKFSRDRSGDINWVNRIYEEPYATILNYLGDFILHLANFSNSSILTKKFHAAFNLYREGVRENSKSSAIIKFATALEYMVQYGEKGKRIENIKCNQCNNEIEYEINDLVSQMFYDRVQYFYEGKIDNKSSIRQDIKKLYDIRSGIVHGSIFQEDELIYSFYPKALEILNVCLVHFLTWVGKTGFDYEVTNEQVIAFLSKINSQPAP